VPDQRKAVFDKTELNCETCRTDFFAPAALFAVLVVLIQLFGR
jgi:hypothetical protein